MSQSMSEALSPLAEKLAPRSAYQSMDLAPEGYGNFFLVRPPGISAKLNKKYVPTVVQQINGQLFEVSNNSRPINWARTVITNSSDRYTSRVSETELEWCHLPT